MNDRERLLRLQARIHRQLRDQVEAVLGAQPAEIARYEEEAARDFRRARLKPLDKAEVIRRLRAAQVTWIADFHADPQNARSALRLLRDAAQPGEDWVLGIEMVPSHHQEDLDLFQAGELDQEKFLERIRYQETWGFPFSHYAPLLDWARRHGVRVLALNLPHLMPGKKSLQERDRWAAGLITDLFLGLPKKQERRVVVLYGELHVAEAHLPNELAQISKRALGRSLRSLSIHQNNEKLYWRLARKGREQGTQAVELREGSLCVFSSPPWVRLDALLRWAEEEHPTHAPSEADPIDEDSAFDPLAALERDGKALAEFLKLEPAPFDSLTAIGLGQAAQLWELAAAEEGKLSSGERRLVRYLVDRNERFYLPGSRAAYLGTSTRAGTAELAALHLLHHQNRENGFCLTGRDDFFRLVTAQAFAFLGSLCLNPRRKCDLEEDHAQRISELQARPRLGLADRAELLARTATLTWLKPTQNSSGHRIGKNRIPRSGLARWLCATYLGRILGMKLHQGVMRSKLKLERLLPEFLEPAEQPKEWRKRHRKLLRAVKDLPLESSKRELL